jgi:hypothetical protein
MGMVSSPGMVGVNQGMAGMSINQPQPGDRRQVMAKAHIAFGKVS